jgi:hypothetical protein
MEKFYKTRMPAMRQRVLDRLSALEKDGGGE